MPLSRILQSIFLKPTVAPVLMAALLVTVLTGCQTTPSQYKARHAMPQKHMNCCVQQCQQQHPMQQHLKNAMHKNNMHQEASQGDMTCPMQTDMENQTNHMHVQHK